MEEDRTNLVQTFLEQRKNKPDYSKIFKIKEDKKEVSSKTFQDQKGTNRDVPKLFQSKEERTKVFQNFSEAKRNK
jgi:hypothetical protein